MIDPYTLVEGDELIYDCGLDSIPKVKLRFLNMVDENLFDCFIYEPYQSHVRLNKDFFECKGSYAHTKLTLIRKQSLNVVIDPEFEKLYI